MTDLMGRLGAIHDIILGKTVYGDEGPETHDIPEVTVDDLGDVELPAGGGTYSQASTPSGKAMPGAVALQNYLLAKFGGTNGGIYNNRSVRGRPGVLSVHAEGRAGDTMVEPELGDTIANWLVDNADRLGIQQVIWNRRSWNSKTRTWRAYNGTNPHTDHVHWELTREAAVATTRGGSAVSRMGSGDDLLSRLAVIDGILQGNAVPAARKQSPVGAAEMIGKPAGDKGDYQAYARAQLAAHGWDESEMAALVALWDRESGWNPNAQNKRSTAYGIAQFLNSTWASTGIEKTNDPYRQIDAGLAYIARRYGDPSTAWAHSQRKGWY